MLKFSASHLAFSALFDVVERPKNPQWGKIPEDDQKDGNNNGERNLDAKAGHSSLNLKTNLQSKGHPQFT